MDEEFMDNWDEERGDIIDDTLGVLKDQEDMQQEITLSGNIQFNPMAFTTGKYILLGPINFESSFMKAPVISFSEVVPERPTQMSSTGSGTGPFIVYPYVHSWATSSAMVDGFVMGLYAVTTPAESAAYTISWVAFGQAPPYKERQTSESWEQPYDFEDSSFLVDDTSGDTEFDNFESFDS